MLDRIERIVSEVNQLADDVRRRYAALGITAPKPEPKPLTLHQMVESIKKTDRIAEEAVKAMEAVQEPWARRKGPKPGTRVSIVLHRKNDSSSKTMDVPLVAKIEKVTKAVVYNAVARAKTKGVEWFTIGHHEYRLKSDKAVGAWTPAADASEYQTHPVDHVEPASGPRKRSGDGMAINPRMNGAAAKITHADAG